MSMDTLVATGTFARMAIAGSNGDGQGSAAANGHPNGAAGYGTDGNGASRPPVKPRVFVAAENRLLREALSRMLRKNGDIEVVTS